MLLMSLSRPLTHCFASSPLGANRSRFFVLSLKMMEKHWSSKPSAVCLFNPSD